MSSFSAYTIGADPCNTQTQTEPILGQLNDGVRYFDLRPVISGGAFCTGHYSQTPVGVQGATGQSFADIISDVNQFTAQSVEGAELLVLYLSGSMETDTGYVPFNQDNWNGLFNTLTKLNYLYVNTSPNVDLTMLTLNDFIGNQQAAVVVVVDPGDPTITLGTYAGQGFYTPDNFRVYNVYADTPDLPTMASDQFTKLQTQRPNPDASYFLLSWTLTQNATMASSCMALDPLGLTGVDILSLAATANQVIWSEQSTLLDPFPRSFMNAFSAQNYPNIILLDAIDSALNPSGLATTVNFTAIGEPYLFYKEKGSSSISLAQPPSTVSPIKNLTAGGWTSKSADSGTSATPIINTTAAPVLAGFYSLTTNDPSVPLQGMVYLFYKNANNNLSVVLPVNAYTLALGFNQAFLLTSISTTDAPACVNVNGTLYLFYKGTVGDSRIWLATSGTGSVWDGGNWTLYTLNSQINTSTTPSAVYFSGSLYLFYTGVVGDNQLYVAQAPTNITDGQAWNSTPLNASINTSSSPALVAFNGDLYLFYVGADQSVYVAQPPEVGAILDGNGWSATAINGITTTQTPAAVVYDESLYLFFVGTDSLIYVAQAPPGNVSGGDGWTVASLSTDIDITTDAAPAVLVF